MKNLRPFVFLCCLFALPFQGWSQTIPNNDFESWTVRARYEPDSGWFTSNEQSLAMHDTLTVWKVPGVSGQAIHIQTAVVGTDTMYADIVNSNMMGVPYTGQPTNITGYYRYNLPGNDSAILYVQFYKAGVTLATNVFYIKGTGSLSTFTPFSLPLLPLSVAPDTVFIAAASNNLISGFGVDPASWLELDQLAFTGTTSPVIAGGSFDSWIGDTTETPIGWVTSYGAGSVSVSRSTTHFWGSYSARLETQVDAFGATPALLVNGMNGTPYTELNDTLTGYYMYTETGGDSASVQAYLVSAGTLVGSVNLNLPAAATWTYFELPLNAISTPDTMALGFFSSMGMPGVTSTLYIDHVRLKSQTAGVTAPFTAVNAVAAYPNPASGELYLKIPQGVNTAATITVYDAAGRNCGQWNYNRVPATVTIPVASLASGVYVYDIRTGQDVYKGNFIKK